MQKRAREWCHRLMDEDQTRHFTPQFTEEETHLLFANTYQSLPHDQPPWRPSLDDPSVEFNTDPITIEEIQAVIK